MGVQQRRFTAGSDALDVCECRHKELDNKLAVEDANMAFYDAFMSGSIKVSCSSSTKQW